MAETTEPQAFNVEGTPESKTSVTTQELEEVIAEFEKYRERLVNEMTITAQKAKLPTKKAMAQIEPELAKIDAALQHLRTQQAALDS